MEFEIRLSGTAKVLKINKNLLNVKSERKRRKEGKKMDLWIYFNFYEGLLRLKFGNKYSSFEV